MQKRVQKKTDEYFQDFKLQIKSQLQQDFPFIGTNTKSLDFTTKQEDFIKTKISSLLQLVYDYNNLQFNNSDFQKRKRTKNSIALHKRCKACKANKSQCTRRKKDNELFCGTHLKGQPHGIVGSTPEDTPKIKQIQISIQEISGILCHLDKEGNVYDPQDIHQNLKNPRIIAKYKYDVINSKYEILR
jgi:hypothetical protein